MADPLVLLRQFITELEAGRELARLIDRQRTISENSQTTLLRLIRERTQLVELLESLGAPHASFDFGFKENLVNAVKSVVDPDRLKLALLRKEKTDEPR